ncbi:hypothetical protein shim_22850 [Shimia sp. SK013]|uniref:hypothetical protein n=1 Tax=Shimia sp. SK013 TaxID=1389006 RepID=UPI0006CDB3D4|nr:hypothetical protein [Shimia sp. SK013]KPA21578.1 hypothetical protein shim_22850 [Shimia sp. SK013]
MSATTQMIRKVMIRVQNAVSGLEASLTSLIAGPQLDERAVLIPVRDERREQRPDQ